MKLAPALVPLEAWFWCMLFLDLLSAKPCLGFLIELMLWYGHIATKLLFYWPGTHCQMLNPSVKEAIFHLKTAVTFLIFIASKLTNEVPFERRKIYLSTDYNIMIMQQLHN
jgi:hypothetical protein